MDLPKGFWYPVLQSREVGHGPRRFERLGQHLVFWRTRDRQPHAHADRCPHLGAALSGGRVCADRLVCPFHGFEFDADGRCRHIPAIGRNSRVPKGMAVRTYALREADGLIWLWWGETPAEYPAVPQFPQLAEGWRHGTIAVDWPVHYTRAIENQLDVAHLAFVHRTTIGAGGRSFVEGPHVEADRQGIRVWVTNARDEGQVPRSPEQLREAARDRPPSLSFLFPGIWLLHIGPRMQQFIAFVPINERTTRYYLRVCHRHRNPLVAKIFEVMIGLSNRFILNQDRRVVVTQTPADSAEAQDDRPIGADRAILEFRRLHAALLAQDYASTGPASQGQKSGPLAETVHLSATVGKTREARTESDLPEA